MLGLGSGVAGGARGWVAGTVGQAYGVFHRPGFGLLVPVHRSLSTQPPFAKQALIQYNNYLYTLCISLRNTVIIDC